MDILYYIVSHYSIFSVIEIDTRRWGNLSNPSPIRAAIRVTSKTPGKNIMCERSMYRNRRGAGTDTIGGYSD